MAQARRILFLHNELGKMKFRNSPLTPKQLKTRLKDRPQGFAAMGPKAP